MATRTNEHHVESVLEWQSNNPILKWTVTALMIIILVVVLGLSAVMIPADSTPTDPALTVQQIFQQDAVRYEAMAAHYWVQRAFEQDAARYEAMAEYYLDKSEHKK